MNDLAYNLLRQIRRACGLGGRIMQRLDQACLREIMKDRERLDAEYRGIMVQIAGEHNMATSPDEKHYLRQYWHWLEPALTDWRAESREGGGEPLILDLGCGQGRLTLPMADWCARNGGRIIGVDISGKAIEFARRTAREAGLSRVVELVEADLLEFLSGRQSCSCQAALCMEVLYMYPAHEELLKELARVMAPGGLFAASFRSRYYNVMNAVANRKWNLVPLFISESEGQPWGPALHFSWQNSEELTSRLERCGFDVRALRGIGVCSGIEDDPLSLLARPSQLDEADRGALLEAELALAGPLADAGRYILVEARRLKGVDNP
ncbi:MAG: class I SAM-dependent methyltransferase [Proteobacteria bacterium]|nr:class I SAM-dependent methyltransferase [Pseudomonadota bacterium]